MLDEEFGCVTARVALGFIPTMTRAISLPEFEIRHAWSRFERPDALIRTIRQNGLAEMLERRIVSI